MNCPMCGENFSVARIRFNVMERTRFEAEVDVDREAVKDVLTKITDVWMMDFDIHCPLCSSNLTNLITDDMERKLRTMVIRVSGKKEVLKYEDNNGTGE